MQDHTDEQQEPQPKLERTEMVHWKKVTRIIYFILYHLQTPEMVGEFIEVLISAHKRGKLVAQGWIVYDAMLAGYVTRNTPDRNRIVARLRNQRQTLFRWQDEKGNPKLVEAVQVRDLENKGQRALAYKLPIWDVVQAAIEKGALTAKDDQLKEIVAACCVRVLKIKAMPKLEAEGQRGQETKEIRRALSTLFNRSAEITKSQGQERLRQMLFGAMASDLERPGMQEVLGELASFYETYCNQ